MPDLLERLGLSDVTLIEKYLKTTAERADGEVLSAQGQSHRQANRPRQ
jgi:hypothetical protein